MGVRRRLGASRWHREDGQATVELALLLPFIVVLALAVAQVGLVGVDQVLLVHSVRSAARATALSGVPGDGQAAAQRASALRQDRMVIDVVRDRGLVVVSGSYRVPVIVPGLSWARHDLQLRASVAMPDELAGVE